jgi:hypothetical protein
MMKSPFGRVILFSKRLKKIHQQLAKFVSGGCLEHTGAPPQNWGQAPHRSVPTGVGINWGQAGTVFIGIRDRFVAELDIGSDAPIIGSVSDLRPQIGAHSLKLLIILQMSC